MDVAKCVRIFEPDPTDDFVTKRQAAIKDLRARFLKQTNIGRLMALGSEVLGVFRHPPEAPQEYADAIEEAIKNQSPSFVSDERDLEMSVCALIAVVDAIENGRQVDKSWHGADVLAVSLWSGASFLPSNPEPKLEDLRLQGIKAAMGRILKSSLNTRSRHEVSDFGQFGDDLLGAGAFREATASTVTALRYNAALDREEIDILWWVLADSSVVLERPLASLSPETRAIVTGLELGGLLRGLPSQSHRNLSQRGISEGEPLPLPRLLDALGHDRPALAENFQNESLVDDAASVFPLLNGIRAGSSTLAGSEVPRPLIDWCARALLESAVLRLQYQEHQKR